MTDDTPALTARLRAHAERVDNAQTGRITKRPANDTEQMVCDLHEAADTLDARPWWRTWPDDLSDMFLLILVLVLTAAGVIDDTSSCSFTSTPAGQTTTTVRTQR